MAGSKDNRSKNTYCISDDCLIFQGSRGRSAMHAHHYIQYGLSSSDAFELKAADWPSPRRVHSFIIPPDVSHQVRLAGTDRVLMAWLDPEFKISRSLSNDTGIRTSLGELEAELKPFYGRQLNCETARHIRQVITGRPATDSSENLDERISYCISWIKEHLTEQTITSEDLAEAVFLSKSRLMHLFSEQIGIPIRKYILWQRLRHALLQMSGGATITEASHSAGFTDSPHMNRTFNAMFGITPSKIFKNSRFIQVIGC